jgi:hypothetical protein
VSQAAVDVTREQLRRQLAQDSIRFAWNSLVPDHRLMPA